MSHLDQSVDIDDVEDAVHEARPLQPGRYRVAFALDGVDFRAIVLDDPVPLGRQILRAAGIHDVDPYALFLITADGDFEDIRPDEEVDLRDRAAYRFIAFGADPLYRFSLDGGRIVWGMPTVSETVLRLLSGARPDQAIFLEVRGGTDRMIADGSQVDLTAAGAEAFITARRPHAYAFFVNGKRYETDKASLTGAEIKAFVPGWDESHDLVLEGHGDEPDRIIDDHDSVQLDIEHGVRRFSSVPKANFG